jgi:hypothetical protein
MNCLHQKLLQARTKDQEDKIIINSGSKALLIICSASPATINSDDYE